MSVVILGTGIAAAFAHRACQDYGIDPVIVSATSPNMAPHGAFWIHDVPASMKDKVRPPVSIKILSSGSPKVYAQTLWRGTHVQTSWDKYADTTCEGYDPFEVIPLLWEEKIWGAAVQDGNWWYTRKFKNDQEIMALASEYDLVIQTFPGFGMKERQLSGVYIHVLVDQDPAPEMPARVTYVGVPPEERNPRDQSLLRVSYLWGYCSKEYALLPEVVREAMANDQVGTIAYQRPLKLHPAVNPSTVPPFGLTNVLMTGRYATWQRKMLAHESYQIVLDELCSRFGPSNKSTTNESKG